MITANDLRINNLVKYNYNIDRMAVVTWIQEDSIQIEFLERDEDLVNGAVASPSLLKPIPLTPELLEKIGFVKGDDDESCQYILRVDSFLEIRLHEDDFSWEFADERETITPNCKWFKSLHQLQNLYFALTNSELPINNL